MRTSRWDALMMALAAAQGVLLLTMPMAPAIALGVWWNSNTISHNFIHRPFFRRRSANALFAAYESVLLGIPQTLWRDRHLAHHAGVHRCRHRTACPRGGPPADPPAMARGRCHGAAGKGRDGRGGGVDVAR